MREWAGAAALERAARGIRDMAGVVRGVKIDAIPATGRLSR